MTFDLTFIFISTTTAADTNDNNSNINQHEQHQPAVTSLHALGYKNKSHIGDQGLNPTLKKQILVFTIIRPSIPKKTFTSRKYKKMLAVFFL